MPKQSTISERLRMARERLRGSESPELDAALLLCRLIGKPRTYLYTWPDKELSEEEENAFEGLVRRRVAGEPIAHILGEREFWNLTLKVTPATLIPRPETELLVEQALQRIPPEAHWKIADLGTGSGAIALVIAKERPGCTVTAMDTSEAALEVALENAQRYALDNLRFRSGNWFTGLEGERFRLIASNPPYVAEEDPHLSQGDLRFEPRSALASGTDGLDDIRRIVSLAPEHLEADGWLLLEHGYDQGDAVRSILDDAGFSEIKGFSDLGGNARVTSGKTP